MYQPRSFSTIYFLAILRRTRYENHMLRQLLFLSFIALFSAFPAAAATLPADTQKAVILSYSRIGENTYPATSIATEQFDAHLEALQSGRYNILPLSRITNALESGETLPANALALTFDGGYASAYEHGMKPLLAADIPFTLGIATDLISSHSPLR